MTKHCEAGIGADQAQDATEETARESAEEDAGVSDDHELGDGRGSRQLGPIMLAQVEASP